MKKRYIFLTISLVSVIILTYLLKNDYENTFIVETKKEIGVMQEKQDSIFLFADDVLDNVMEQKKEDSTKMSDLDEMVKKKQIKIEDQVVQLKKLVKESNKMKELAEEEKNKAIEMKKMADLQKIESEKNREKLNSLINEIEKENGLLKKKEIGYLETIKEMEEKISFLRNKIDSLTGKGKIKDTENEDKKKKRRGN
jgi:hypothetical protein